MAWRVGLIGAGFAGGTHARACLTLPDVEVVSVAAAHPDEAAALATECGARVAESAGAVVADDGIDVVVVASPTYLHADHAIAAAQARKHVFCEKPLARTAEQGAAIVEACDRAGVSLGVGHVVRFSAEYGRTKELIETGALGRPAVATLTRGSFSVGNVRPWYLDAAKSGRVILDLMIHDLDTLRWWFGEPQRVYGRTIGGAGGLDYALATVAYADGPIVQVEASWAEHAGFRTTFEVRGDAGLVTHDSRAAAPLQTQLPETSGVPPVMPVTTLRETSYRRQLREYFAALDAGAPAPVPGLEGLRSLSLALAVMHSAERGEPVTWSLPA